MDNHEFSDEPGVSVHQPVFNLPWIIVLLCGVTIAVHIVRVWLVPPAGDTDILVAFSFIPARYGDLALHDPWPLARYWSPITYSFLHADWTHLLINLFWMLAFGSVVARRFGAWRFSALCIAGSIAGAAAHLFTHGGEMVPVIGASAVVSCCMGAAVRFAFPPGGPFGRDVSQMPAQSLIQAFSNRQVLTFTGVWFGLNLLIGTGMIPLAGAGQSIAWEAHIGGFLAGLLLFSLFDRRR